MFEIYQVNGVVVKPLWHLLSLQERTGKSVLHAVDHMDDGTPINLIVSIDEEKVNHPRTSRTTTTRSTTTSIFISLRFIIFR